MRTFLGLGANLGDRAATLAGAVAALPDVVAVSPVYETAPVGGPEGSPPYLNAVVELRSDLGPRPLLDLAQRLEAAAGRERTVSDGPRTLDVDVLLVGGLAVDEPDLVVPHPRMWRRRFVLAPLADFAPEVVDAERLAAAEGEVRRTEVRLDAGPVRVVRSAPALAAALDAERAAGRRVGLVPTMGALHGGHAELVRRSAAENDVTCVSIYVNPLQFGAGEDLAGYPRDLEADLRVAAAARATVAFVPPPAEMDVGPTRVTVGGPGAVLEARHRPGHFEGVTTIVTRLFSLVGRSRAYFGEKDYQQLVIVRHLAADLGLPVEVVGCPTVRASDGLALSSRNAYLTREERAAAPVLFRALRAGAAAVLAGERDPAAVSELVGSIVEAEPSATLVSSDVVDAATLVAPPTLGGSIRLLVAARFGRARLLDNIGVRVP